jgi:hypothetical protein
MASGFVQRFKGKVTTFVGGIYQGGVQSQATFVNAGAPTNWTSGTLAGIATVGSQVIDTTNGVTYLNTGTAASPTWQATGGAGGAAQSVATGLTATGSTFAGALPLTAHDNVMATVAAGTGVVLRALSPGQSQRIWDRTGTVALQVYAPGGATIDGTAGSTGVVLTAPKAIDFFAQTGSTFVSAALGAVSS